MEIINESSITLWIDTATPVLMCALSRGKKTMFMHQHKGHNDHSATLMPTIVTLLEKANLTVKAIDQITVGVGPGSYTGTRIGVVVAKTLAWSLNIPLYQLSSLALLASSVKGPCIAAIDARRGYVFAGKYHNEAHLSCLLKDRYTTLDAVQESAPLPVVYEGVPRLEDVWALCTYVNDLEALTPTYLRLTEAEQNHAD